MKRDNISNTNSCVKLNLWAVGKLALSSNILVINVFQASKAQLWEL